jgi:hypothetical protein
VTTVRGADATPRAIDALLQDCVGGVIANWVGSWRDALRFEGRAMAGGWPGTVPEARARLVGQLGPELARRGLLPPSADRIAEVSREIYAGARRAWLAEATRGDDRGEQAISSLRTARADLEALEKAMLGRA